MVTRAVTAGLLCLGLTTGCQMPGQSTSCGWRFEILKPAAVLSPALVQQGAGPLSVSALGAGPAAVAMPPAMPPSGLRMGGGPCEQGPALGYGADPCTLADVCRMLADISRRLPPPPGRAEPIARPLPSTP